MKRGIFSINRPLPLHFKGSPLSKRNHSQGGKNYSQLKASHPLSQIKTFSLKEEDLEDHLLFQRGEGYSKISSEDRDPQVQSQPLKTEIESEDSYLFVL